MDNTPLCTYRLQLSAALKLSRVTHLVPYFQALGVSHLHLSPLHTARPGSDHCYDVVSHSSLNPELGTEADLQSLSEMLASRDMGLIVDLVPNHMCIASPLNLQWQDVLENGKDAASARFFDIDWGPPKAQLVNKVLLPVLGAQFGHELEQGAVQVIEHGGVFVLTYGNLRLPVTPPSWQNILQSWWTKVRDREGDDGGDAVEIESVLRAIKQWPHQGGPRVWRHERDALARRITSLCNTSATARDLEDTLNQLNGTAGVSSSFDPLEDLVAQQHYRLAHWRVAAQEINYRRFFDVDALAAIRVEDEEVFKAVHALPEAWLAKGTINGFRVDHVDGLLEPESYLNRLRDFWKGSPSYVVVEKILSPGESLPETWAVAGTTGYEHIATVSGVLVDADQAAQNREAWRALTGHHETYRDTAYQSKRLILCSSLAAELTVLGRRLDDVSEQHRYSRDFTLASLIDCLREVIACFPCYRTYTTRDATVVSERDARMISLAVEEAARRNPVTNRTLFDFVHDVLMLREPEGLTPEQQHARREFVLRFQQLTGPVTAKGLEDTCFYRYFPVLALAEVGGEPDRLGISVDEFHVIQRARAETRPRGLSASATHDTKRGEDMRARLLVLSEIPNEWSEAVLRWREMNASHRTRHGGKDYPDPLSEVFIYQSLLGGCPAGGPHCAPTFIPRLKAAVRKAFSEAKLQTSWINPNEFFESAVDHFVDGILGGHEEAFVADFARFAERIRMPATLNSLAQTLVKVAGPGIPEIYQGTELWDHSFVDPDNRRPVNFDAMAGQLTAVSAVDDSNAPEFLSQALKNPDDGALKLFVLYRCLQLRRLRRSSFESHRYEGCRVSGPLARHVLGFARGHAGERIIGVSGRLFAGLTADGTAPVGSKWVDNFVEVPELSFELRYRDVVSGRSIVPQNKDGSVGFALDDVFGALPLALIEEHT